MSTDNSTHDTGREVFKVSEMEDRSPFMVVAAPLVGTPVDNSQSHDFTGADFEDALDKVSRSIMGKYADAMPSTEEFIRQRRKEGSGVGGCKGREIMQTLTVTTTDGTEKKHFYDEKIYEDVSSGVVRFTNRNEALDEPTVTVCYVLNFVVGWTIHELSTEPLEAVATVYGNGHA